MDYKQDRVFAYKLAKLETNKDLLTVSQRTDRWALRRLINLQHENGKPYSLSQILPPPNSLNLF